MTDALTASNTALLRLAGELVKALERIEELGEARMPINAALVARECLAGIPPDLRAKIEEARGA